MSYSQNNNQNYFIQDNRSTSRVLQPPGGSSSLCLGGYGGAPEQSVPRGKRASGSGVAPNNAHQGRTARQDGRRDSLDEFMGGGVNCGIPGLQEHYSRKPLADNRRGSHAQEDALYAAAGGGGGGMGPRGALSSQDYASQLREQIETKRSLERDDRTRHTSSHTSDTSYIRNSDRLSSEGSYGGRSYQRDENVGYSFRPSSFGSGAAPGGNAAGGLHGTGRSSSRVSAPPGGKSSFSLGWS